MYNVLVGLRQINEIPWPSASPLVLVLARECARFCHHVGAQLCLSQDLSLSLCLYACIYSCRRRYIGTNQSSGTYNRATASVAQRMNANDIFSLNCSRRPGPRDATSTRPVGRRQYRWTASARVPDGDCVWLRRAAAWRCHHRRPPNATVLCDPLRSFAACVATALGVVCQFFFLCVKAIFPASVKWYSPNFSARCLCIALIHTLVRRWFQSTYKKLIRRWDGERELSLRRQCTRTKIQ